MSQAVPTPSGSNRSFKTILQTSAKAVNTPTGGSVEDALTNILWQGGNLFCQMAKSPANGNNASSFETLVGDVVSISKQGLQEVAHIGLGFVGDKISQYVREGPTEMMQMASTTASTPPLMPAPIETEPYDSVPIETEPPHMSAPIETEPPHMSAPIEIETYDSTDSDSIEMDRAFNDDAFKSCGGNDSDTSSESESDAFNDALQTGIDPISFVSSEDVPYQSPPIISFKNHTRTFQNLTAKSLYDIAYYLADPDVPFRQKVRFAETVSFMVGEGTISFILIGNTQHGKSSTAKTILGLSDEDIKIGDGYRSESDCICDYKINKGDVSLVLTDTYGFFDSGGNSQRCINKIIQCIIDRDADGNPFDAIIITAKIGEAMHSSYNIEVLKLLKNRLGKLLDKLVVIVTFAASSVPIKIKNKYAKQYGRKSVTKNNAVKIAMYNEYYAEITAEWKKILGDNISVTFIENDLYSLEHDEDKNLVLPNGVKMFHSFYSSLLLAVDPQRLLPLYAFIGRDKKDCVKSINIHPQSSSTLNPPPTKSEEWEDEGSTDADDYDIRFQREKGIENTTNELIHELSGGMVGARSPARPIPTISTLPPPPLPPRSVTITPPPPSFFGKIKKFFSEPCTII